MRLHRTIAILLAVTVAGIVTVIASGTAHACSCMQQTLKSQAASAGVVFTGTPKNSDAAQNPTSSAEPVRWTFAVDAVQKGTVTRTVTVTSALDSASCGIPFQIDRRYLVIGIVDGGTISANLCSGTAAVDQLPPDALKSLGDGVAPVANPQTVPTQDVAAATQDVAAAVGPSGNSGAGPVVAVALGVALVVAAALILLWRRARRAI